MNSRGFIQIPLLILIIGGLIFVAHPAQAGFFDWFANIKSFFIQEKIEESLPASVSESVKETPSLEEESQEVIEETQPEVPKEIIKETTIEKIIYKDNPEQARIIQEQEQIIEDLRNQIAVLKNRIKQLEEQLTEMGQTAEPLIPLEIALIEAENSYNSATITWLTNKYSNSIAEYGSDIFTYEYKVDGDTEISESNKYIHTVYLENLSPETTYHYNIISIDNDGQRTQSGDKTFTTHSVPLSEIGTLSISTATGDFPTFKLTTGSKEAIRITSITFKVIPTSSEFTLWTGPIKLTGTVTSSNAYLVFNEEDWSFYPDMIKVSASASRTIHIEYDSNEQIDILLESTNDIQAVGLESRYAIPEENITISE